MPTVAHSKISSGGKQHVQFFRKVLLRKRMLRLVRDDLGAAYVPFIGDGDIAVELYSNRTVYGADLDPARCEIARGRLASSSVKVYDCDLWPFDEVKDRIVVGDFDAYADPYTSFRAFWAGAEKADRMALFFTDGLPQGIIRSGVWRKPNGDREDDLPPLPHRRRSELYNHYLGRFVWPWFEAFVQPYRVLDRMRYRRHHIVYWGCVIER